MKMCPRDSGRFCEGHQVVAQRASLGKVLVRLQSPHGRIQCQIKVIYVEQYSLCAVG